MPFLALSAASILSLDRQTNSKSHLCGTIEWKPVILGTGWNKLAANKMFCIKMSIFSSSCLQGITAVATQKNKQTFLTFFLISFKYTSLCVNCSKDEFSAKYDLHERGCKLQQCISLNMHQCHAKDDISALPYGIVLNGLHSQSLGYHLKVCNIYPFLVTNLKLSQPLDNTTPFYEQVLKLSERWEKSVSMHSKVIYRVMWQSHSFMWLTPKTFLMTSLEL